ncbi:MAG TPA: long-chain fatty acid--CoA ligase [Gaiellaceae bacterium]|nr:long-chain fatty acid--CoA ligase [Gaiellaceae bacterium]
MSQVEAVEAARPDDVRRRRTIPNLWRNSLAAGHPEPAYLHEVDGDWRPVTRPEAARAIDEIANGLLALGLRKGDAVALIGRTTLEWALVDFALGLVGAVGAPVYANSSARDVQYVLAHSRAVAAVVEDADQREKLGAFAGAVVTFDDLDELRARGRAHAEAHPGALDERADAVGEDDLFTFIYTSGTTGPPKACMIRHRNYYAMVAKADELEDRLTGPDDVMLLYLPLAHNYGRLLHLSAAYVGYTLAFLPDPLSAAAELPRVRPTLFPSVPRVYEKIHTAVRAGLEAETGVKRRVAEWSLSVGYRVSQLQQARRPVPPLLAAQHTLADRLVYSKVKSRLGGRLRVANSGGAPLAREIAEFFHALGILVLEGYGLSEVTTAATVNRPGDFKFGTVGKPLPGVEIEIADDGEILIRSDTVFAGYYDDPAATAETLDGRGFVHTGDVGYLDEDGFLVITDRKKDIIVTAGGKNVAPQNLENELKAHTVVSQALVVGDRRPYVAALVTVDPAATAGMSPEDVHAAVERAVAEVNEGRSRYEQIKRFRILPREFTLEEDEVTPTLKLRRRVIVEHFADDVEQLYA